jgi:hypothetical protein
MIPKQTPIINIVPKYVKATFPNLDQKVIFRFSQYTSDGSGALSK